MLIPSGPVDARMMIVADCVSYRDLQSNTILNDREFDRMLAEAGVNRNACFVTAFIRGQITGQNFDLQVAPSIKARTPDHMPLHNKYVKKAIFPYLEALERDIDLVKPKIVLLLGNAGLFALTGKWGIKSHGAPVSLITLPLGGTSVNLYLPIHHRLCRRSGKSENYNIRY
jgi:uracil-DNA glycosylase